MGEIIAVNREKCIQCGACAEVCPTSLVEMEAGWPEEAHGFCIACGHCVAVCPTAAMDNANAMLAEQTPLEAKNNIGREQARQFIRSRRSTRCFTGQMPGRGEVEELLDLVRFAPSGTNAQGTSWLVIQKEDTLEKIAFATVDYIEQAGREKGHFAALMAQIAMRLRQNERQGVLRSAPCLLVSLCKRKLDASRRNNAVVAQTVAELYAPMVGLASCWAGYVELALLAGYPPLLEVMGIPAGKAAAGAIMLGYPKYQYHRMPGRDPLTLYWAT